MTTTYKMNQLHSDFKSVLLTIIATTYATYSILSNASTKAKQERIANLISTFTLNPLVTTPDLDGVAIDLEARINRAINLMVDNDQGVVGVRDSDLLKYELKELAYMFLTQVNIDELRYYFNSLCIEPSEKYHYSQELTDLYRAMVVICVIIRSSSVFVELVTLTSSKGKKDTNVQ